MPLESANFIPELVETNPDGTDLAATLDDHARLTKKAVKGSFPNFVGTTATPKSVSKTEDEINDAAEKSADNVFTGANDFAETTRVQDLDGNYNDVGFRWSRKVNLATSEIRDSVQADEGKTILTEQGAATYRIGVLQVFTAVRCIAWQGAMTLQANGVTLRWLDGSGAQVEPTSLTLDIGGVAELYWSAGGTIYVFGNGLS